MLLRIAGIVQESVVDGPGLRYAIFTQGCPHHCVGCHNPHTHDSNGGYAIAIEELFGFINETKLIDGVTFTGGEPFAQATACGALARLVKQHRPELSILAYSGYYYNDLLAMAAKNHEIRDFLQLIDTLIDGPYDIKQNNPNLPFRGSDNQSIIELSNAPLQVEGEATWKDKW